MELPNSLPAEELVLGTIIRHKEACTESVAKLSPEAFFDDVHQEIFSAACKLFSENIPVHNVTLYEEVKNNKEFLSRGGIGYLEELESKSTTDPITPYISILNDKFKLREKIKVSSQFIIEAGRDLPDKTKLTSYESLLVELSDSKDSENCVLASGLVENTLEKAYQNYRTGNLYTGVRTWIKSLDKLTGGLQKQDLVVVAARPNIGKSALGLTVVQNIILNDITQPVVFFSLEMSRQSLVVRLLAGIAKVPFYNVMSGLMAEREWARVLHAAELIKKSNFIIDDTPSINPLYLRSKMKYLKHVHPTLDLAIVDYLQLMTSHKKSNNRNEEITAISAAVKACCKDTNMPIMALSQLNRMIERRGKDDRRPMLSDLRDGGSIEQDADIVVFIHREEFYNPTDENKGLAELIIAKQRNGPLGTINCAFISKYARFENVKLI